MLKLFENTSIYTGSLSVSSILIQNRHRHNKVHLSITDKAVEKMVILR